MRLNKMTLNEWIEKHEEEHRYVKIGTIDGSSFLYCGRYVTKNKIVDVSITIFERLLKSKRCRSRAESFVDFGHRRVVAIKKAPISGATIILIEGDETLNLWDEDDKVDMKGLSVVYSKER